MQAQVLFKIDRAVKEKAMKRAKIQGLSFGAVLKLATNAYAEGTLNIGVMPANFKTFKPTAKDLRELREAEEDYRKGNYIDWKDLKHELDNSHRTKSA